MKNILETFKNAAYKNNEVIDFYIKDRTLQLKVNEIPSNTKMIVYSLVIKEYYLKPFMNTNRKIREDPLIDAIDQRLKHWSQKTIKDWKKKVNNAS